MALTDLFIRNIKPTDKDQWFTHEKSLRLLVKPNGSKYWRYQYRYADKKKTLALGVYPEVSLKQASNLAMDARRLLVDSRKLLDQSIDPLSQIAAKAIKNAATKLAAIKEEEVANQFSQVAADWFEFDRGTWTPDHANRVWKPLAP